MYKQPSTVYLWLFSYSNVSTNNSQASKKKSTSCVDKFSKESYSINGRYMLWPLEVSENVAIAFQLNTHMPGLRLFSHFLSAFESSLSIGRVRSKLPACITVFIDRRICYVYWLLGEWFSDRTSSNYWMSSYGNTHLMHGRWYLSLEVWT